MAFVVTTPNRQLKHVAILKDAHGALRQTAKVTANVARITKNALMGNVHQQTTKNVKTPAVYRDTIPSPKVHRSKIKTAMSSKGVVRKKRHVPVSVVKRRINACNKYKGINSKRIKND